MDSVELIISISLPFIAWISLSLATQRDVVVQICRSIAGYGPRRFYVLNTGVSTVRALKPAAELRVVLQGNAGGPGPAQLFVFSDRPQYNANSAFRNEGFPWHRINPVELWPGVPVTACASMRPLASKMPADRSPASRWRWRLAAREVRLTSSPDAARRPCSGT